jgi:SAM-dependent methyltransferase
VSNDGRTLYDVVPYPARELAQSHPRRLAAIARLYGVPAALPSRCRLLEVGCSDGGNLIAMAQALPDARFVGIDTSSTAIAAARENSAGIENVTFEELSLADYDPPPGSFDYVVAHGVYSWVPEHVRDALLALCERALAEHGVAYVSYNTLPGGVMRELVREILLRHVGAIEDPEQQMAAARQLLELLRVAWSYDPELSTLVSIATRMRESGDALLFHDTLAPENARLEFADFVAHAGAYGLQFLAEANFWEMQVGWLPPELRVVVTQIPNRLQREQLIDELRLRTFRQTLLCHAALQIDEPRPEPVASLAVSTQARYEPADESGAVTFATPSGATLTTAEPLVVDTLQRVVAASPGAVAVASLWPPDAPAEDRDAICMALLRCYAGALVELTAEPAPDR